MRHAAVSAFVRILLAMVVLPSTLYAQRVTSVFPQFAAGGGWSSDIFIDNQGNASAAVDISFFASSGQALEVDSNLGVGSSFSFTLAGGNTKAVRVTPGAALKTGYVVLSFPETASVRASEIFRYEQAGAVVSVLGVPQQFALNNNFSFPAEVESARRITTGLAIANGTFGTTSSVAQRYVVSLIRSDGSLQASTTVSLAAGGHISAYLDSSSLFPGLDNFSGVVSVSGALPFGLLALRQEQAVFGTVSVDAGPIVSPFLLTTAAVSETEPNSTSTQAQVLSAATVVSGTISFSGDLDFFQITGKQGDIVTAVVSTEGLSSSLDPELFLLNSSGTVIAYNDENGLIAESDSFLRVALQSDGSYHLVIQEFTGRGASTFRYRLHVQVQTPVSPLAPESSSPRGSKTQNSGEEPE